MAAVMPVTARNAEGGARAFRPSGPAGRRRPAPRPVPADDGIVGPGAGSATAPGLPAALGATVHGAKASRTDVRRPPSEGTHKASSGRERTARPRPDCQPPARDSPRREGNRRMVRRPYRPGGLHSRLNGGLWPHRWIGPVCTWRRSEGGDLPPNLVLLHPAVAPARGPAARGEATRAHPPSVGACGGQRRAFSRLRRIMQTSPPTPGGRAEYAAQRAGRGMRRLRRCGPVHERRLRHRGDRDGRRLDGGGLRRMRRLRRGVGRLLHRLDQGRAHGRHGRALGRRGGMPHEGKRAGGLRRRGRLPGHRLHRRAAARSHQAGCSRLLLRPPASMPVATPETRTRAVHPLVHAVAKMMLASSSPSSDAVGGLCTRTASCRSRR